VVPKLGYFGRMMTGTRMSGGVRVHLSTSARPKAKGRDERPLISLGLRDPAHFTSALSSARRSVTTHN